jgi:hypothetical protein
MARFSIGTAISEGFGLVRRRPFSVLVWGLLMTAPMFAAFGLMIPAMAEMFANMPDPDMADAVNPAFSEGLVGHMMQFQMASLLANLMQYVGMALVYTAIFRAILRPSERSFFSIRLGMDELRVAVAGLAIGIGIYVVMIVGILLCVALGFALWTQGAAVALWTCGILGLAMLLAMLWGLARLSLIAPASILYRDFAFAQGWKLAAGKGGGEGQQDDFLAQYGLAGGVGFSSSTLSALPRPAASPRATSTPPSALHCPLQERTARLPACSSASSGAMPGVASSSTV